MAGGTDKASPLHIRIGLKLQGDVSSDSLSCSIFRVPNHLRQISEQAYKPQVISIGPYHHGNDQLKAMEVHKMHYLKMLLNRIKKISLERYVTALEGMKEEARKCYSEPLDKIGGEEFVEMMLLDGCFIIELIRKSVMKELRFKDDHLLTHFILRTVLRDLLLVENQLPFFVLSKLFDMTVMPNETKDFKDMAINCFSRMMPGAQIGRTKNQHIKHLLGLLHDCWASSPDCQEVFIPCSSSPEDHESLEEAKFLPPKGKRNCCSSEVAQSSSEPSEEVRNPLPKAMDISDSLPSNKLSMAAPFVSFSPPKSPKAEMAAPSVGFSPPKSSEQVMFPPSESDNLLFQAAAAPPTSSLPPKSSEEVRFLPPKAMAIPSSSLSKSSELEESIVTAAPLAGFSAPNSPKEVKCLPYDSSHLRYLEEKDALAAEPSISFLPPKSSKEEEIVLRVGAAPLIDFPPSETFNEVRIPPPTADRDSKRASGHNKNKWEFIRSATELSEAGINFEKIEGRLFDIRFKRGVLSIPTLNINDQTESILRNLVAYEQWFKGASSKCFTDYVTFMDCLINTEKDVELLCLSGVLDNWLGDHEVVSAIFNRLRDSVLISQEDFSYANTFNEVNKHCNRQCNWWMAILWHNYFNTPWASISFFAALFLLLLTVLQSVYSVLSYQFK